MLTRFLIILLSILCIRNSYGLRIISLSPYLTESIILLEAEDSLVGIIGISQGAAARDRLKIGVSKLQGYASLPLALFP